MKELLINLNQISSGATEPNELRTKDTSITPIINTENPDIAAMQTILESLNTATLDAAEKLVEDTSLGLHKNNSNNHRWRICVDECDILNGYKKRIYDVITPSGEIIAEKLFNYSAARALIKLYKNKNVTNVTKIKEILNLEEQYASAFSMSIDFKQKQLKHEKAGNTNKAILSESLFEKHRNRVRKLQKILAEKEKQLISPI